MHIMSSVDGSARRGCDQAKGNSNQPARLEEVTSNCIRVAMQVAESATDLVKLSTACC